MMLLSPNRSGFAFRALTTSLLLSGSTLFVQPVYAQSLDDSQGGAVEISEGPSTAYPAKGAPGKNSVVGRRAAQKYMGQKGSTATAQAGPPAVGTSNPEPRRDIASRSPSAHYLAIYVGSYLSDNAYQWGPPSGQNNVGRWKAGVTYRFGEWLNSTDLGLRVEVENFTLGDGTARKLSFTPIISFPDANSKFPLYFGGGLGPGVFLQQIDGLSTMTFDYTLFAGVRFFDLYENTGAFIEAGLKNNFFLFSSGQFNGYYATIGAVFTF